MKDGPLQPDRLLADHVYMTSVAEVASGAIARDDGRRVRPGRPLRVYALSRLLTLAVAAVAAAVGTEGGIIDFLTQWDAEWFLRVVRDGYPSHIPEVAGRVGESTIPFFPLFPLVTKLVSWLLPVSDAVAGLLVSLACGAVFAVLLHRLACRIAGPVVAHRTLVLFCFFPGSMVLSMQYSEGLMLVLAAGCLIALMDQRWLLAGVCAGLATACRATALALVLVCLWQAFVAIRERREWRALVAPALAPTGIVAFFAFLWIHTGEPLAYVRAERAWGIQPGLGRTSLELAGRFLVSPFDSPMVAISGLSLVFAAVAGVVLARRHWPPILTVYTFSILGLSVASRSDGLRPRDLLMAFPLLLAVGATTSGARFRALSAVFGGLLVLSLISHNLGIWAQP